MTALQARLESLLANQSEHPVYPVIELRAWDDETLQAQISVGAQSLLVDAEQVVKLRDQREVKIKREKEDRFRYRCEPEMWREIDLQMARKRLENPGVQLELLVMGGVRGSKTDFTHSRAMLHFFYCHEAWVWGLHETQTSSKRIQQRRFMEFFPTELNPESGKMKKDRKTKMNYSEGAGFTGDSFSLKWTCRDEDGNEYEAGGLCDFKFYRSTDSSLQGSELTCAVSDELVPLETVDTVRERLLSRSQDTRHPKFLARIAKAVAMLEAGETLPGPLIGAIYHGVHLIGFTPKEGYSNTVANFLDGSRTTVEVPAELMPGKMVPRFKQPKKRTRLVAYLHTYDNAHKGNWPAMVQQCKEATEGYIRIIAYGDTAKGWSVRFAKFRDTVHVVTRDALPKKGTWYHVIDPHGDRMWFMVWALVCPNGNVYIVREAPLEGDFIPDIGDPGPWALTSTLGFRNGDKGDGQEGRGWGIRRFVEEIKRVEVEIGKWWNVNGESIVPFERIVDSRGGQAPTMHAGAKSTIFDDLEATDLTGFALADGGRLSDGDQKINDALDYEDTGRAPTLYICADCPAVLFMLQNYGNPLKPKDEACKEPRDCLAYLLLAEPCHLSAGAWNSSGGGSY